MLKSLGAKYGLSVSIVDLVGDDPEASSFVATASSSDDEEIVRRAQTPAPGVTELGPHVSSSKVNLAA